MPEKDKKTLKQSPPGGEGISMHNIKPLTSETYN